MTDYAKVLVPVLAMGPFHDDWLHWVGYRSVGTPLLQHLFTMMTI